ncbi:hypothetical protein LK468_16990 [Mycobacteroides abscessus]|uniref:hypothetical protein n=1 Tax=Mycobacteroides abscessus TaxID=36809 RepID=UPI0005E1A38F|nr:hypothetical protein [Mycobacteroides abscessus]UEA47878.1 hypothetical protein LK451_19235 [Mycobacteroides abscessus subsp. abscessus]UEA52141.1 hypothetical protein LK468_16990 [Mycobacteroides abscessus]CPW81237.1 Uncharacterised protein [Mycobacteroides abscessus]SKE35212.1 Uncharacterised protein [Mycobacteroides abscessus subsp. bolletii]SKG47311.1 Uncharacterised protein [Mycobacteroides abscessus subsp. bolletii]
MSPTLDTVLTIAGFVAVFIGVGVVVSVAPFAMLMGDAVHKDSPAIQSYLIVVAVILPPVLVVTEYLIGIVLAWRNPGLTFYYPWIILAIGGASWWAVATVIDTWFENAKLNVTPRRRDVVKRYAVQGTIHNLADSEIDELDGLRLDDGLGWRDRTALTPTVTSRRERAIPRDLFQAKHRTFTVRADKGLPPGWRIERSEIAGEAAGPGGGTQYVFIAPDGQTPTFRKLVERGFLEEASE